MLNSGFTFTLKSTFLFFLWVAFFSSQPQTQIMLVKQIMAVKALARSTLTCGPDNDNKDIVFHC